MRVPGADLDLRLVGYFTAVAEHQNFGRAAAALHVAQPALSRQIQRLEDRIGVRLFDRTPQGSRLTEAGHAFLPEARRLLRTADQAVLAAREAAPGESVTIGYADDLVITPAIRDLRRRRPAAVVHTRHVGWNDPGVLAERRVDALVTRAPLPFPDDGLHTTVLYREPRVLVLPRTHHLAGRVSVTLRELAGEAALDCPHAEPAWGEFWRLGPVLADVPVAAGYDFEEKLDLVAEERAVLALPAGDRRVSLHPDLVTVPITDAEPCRVVVLTRSGERSPLVGAFRASALACLSGPAVVTGLHHQVIMPT
ncbi:LysR family transcriptional regulator [Catenuloplanes sp. NPDC051500]|uniref:LysR family transcriptional regulator n=1 Tax=Catenuloplanes sp. NPDC051500 TaxID=3363959 RepID=UPI0037A8DD2F